MLTVSVHVGCYGGARGQGRPCWNLWVDCHLLCWPTMGRVDQISGQAEELALSAFTQK